MLPEIKLTNLLSNIPAHIDSIATFSSQYHPSVDYYNLLNQPFYKKLHYHNTGYGNRKIALRTRSNLTIAQSNHSANYDYRKNGGEDILLLINLIILIVT